MKFFLIVNLIIISCNTQTNYNEKKLIYDFVNNVVLKDNIDEEIVTKYLLYSENTNFSSLIEMIHYLKNDIPNNFIILKHSELEKENIDSKFIFDNYKKVYHLISNKKIITSFIIKNEKIISFFYAIQKHKTDKLYPALLIDID